MKRKILLTADGSTTIHLEDWDEQYHSKHGAIQEAYHVFIKKGLDYFVAQEKLQKIAILEIGFGTGLNGFITYLEALKNKYTIAYQGVEVYPISEEEVSQLNYVTQLNAITSEEIFKKMHQISWEKKHILSEKFTLKKRRQFFSEIEDKNTFNIIYFDAFGARVQPELWTEAIFKKMFIALKSKGILVTYAAKGSVRRAMQTVGFTVERLDGPPGKREMLRATKP